MRQEINLYVPDLRPQRLWLSLRQAIFLMALLMISLMVATLNSYKEKERYSLLNKELISLVGENENIKSSDLLARIEEKRDLIERQIEDISLVIEKKKVIKTAYHSNTAKDGASFYNIFNMIGQSADPDISLSEINIYNGGSEIILGGVSRYKEKIPEYLGGLKRQKVISGSVFGLLSISKQDSGSFYRFEMARRDVK